jgi:hypothetical protein
MTLIEQFPDVSTLIRKKKKVEVKYKAAEVFKDLELNSTKADQDFYDREFRIWHYKLLVFLGLLFSTLFYLILNGRSILNWIAS